MQASSYCLETTAIVPAFNFHLIAVGYFVVFMVVGYIVYLNKKVKG